MSFAVALGIVVASCLALGGPIPAGAQPMRAGVVTTLQGTVLVQRTPAPEPIALRFKDDVYVRDRITTREASLARVLLGGTRLVTVREYSVLTITESPGVATLEIESGAVGVTVARDPGAPSYVLRVKTPNAVAAVRGTLLITEVDRTAGGLAGRPGEVVSRFHVLSDPTGRGVEIAPEDSRPGVPTPPPIVLRALETFTAVGVAPGQVSVLSPARAGEILQRFRPRGRGAVASPLRGAVASGQVEMASALAASLVGDPQLVVAGSTLTVRSPLIRQIGGETQRGPTAVMDVTNGAVVNLAEVLQLSGGARFLSEGPLLSVSDSTVTVEAGSAISVTDRSLLAFGGSLLTARDSTIVVRAGSGIDIVRSSELTSADALLSLSGSRLTVSGDGITLREQSSVVTRALLSATDSVVEVGGVGIRLLDGSTATVETGTSATRSDLHFGGTGFSIEGGSRGSVTGSLVSLTDSTATGPGAGVSLRDGSTGTVGGSLLSAVGSTVSFGTAVTLSGGSTGTVGGPAFSASGSRVTIGGDAISLSGGSISSAAGAVHVDQSTVTIGGHGIHVAGASHASGSGPAILARDSTVEVAGNALEITGGSSITSNGALVSAVNSTFRFGGLLHLTGGSRATHVGDGSAVRLEGSSVTAASLISTDNAGNVVVTEGSLLEAIDSRFSLTHGSARLGTGDAVLLTGVDVPILRLTRTDLVLADSAGLPLLDLGVEAGVPPVFPGRVATIRGGTINLGRSPLLHLAGITTATPSPLIDAGEGAVVIGSGAPMVRAGGPVATSLAGPLLSTSDARLTGWSSLLAVDAGLVQAGPGPAFLSLDASTASASGDLVRVEAGATMALARPLLRAAGGEVTAGGSLLRVDQGTVRGSSADAMLEATGVRLTAGRAISVDAALLEASSPLLSLRAGGLFTSGAEAVDLGPRARVSVVGALVTLDAAQLSVLAGALVRAHDATLLVAGDLVRLANGSALNVVNGALLRVSGGSVVDVSGALVNFSGSGNVVAIANGLCTGSCLSIGGVPVALLGGASAAQISIGPTPIKNQGTGGVVTLAGANTAVIVVEGPAGRVTIRGQ